jgi:hypothetical protein
MTKSGWLQCESVVRGMFSDELAVVVARSNGVEESYFVPAEDVDRERSRVRVGLRDAGTLIWATLPTPDHVTIPVQKSRVVMA